MEQERVHAALDRARAEQRAELDRERTTMLGDLVEQRVALEAEVARLRRLERDHRDRMREYLTEQLAQIESNTPS